MTNDHRIENAHEVIVRFRDSRKFTARVIGRGAKTDLAVPELAAPGPLPAGELGDSP